MLLHRLLHGLADHLVDGLAVTQTDLLLGRMDIDIHVLRRQVQVDEACRISSFHQEIAQPFGNGMNDHPVADGPAIDQQPDPGRAGHDSIRRQEVAVNVGSVTVLIVRLSHLHELSLIMEDGSQSIRQGLA